MTFTRIFSPFLIALLLIISSCSSNIYNKFDRPILVKNILEVNDSIVKKDPANLLIQPSPINKFLSYYTPKEVIINELNFQEGWEIQAYKKVGRDLVKVVRKEDEDLRVVRLAGNVHSNSILLDDHFNSFISTLNESGLFQNIEIMSQGSKVGFGKDNLQFELKCVI